MVIRHRSLLFRFLKLTRVFILSKFLLHCGTNKNAVLKPIDSSLQLINDYSLEVPEPSGLSLGENNQTLWTVSDPPVNQIYELDLEGNILRTLDFKGDDLEGIDYDSVENVLWIAEEQKRELVKLTLDGTELERHPIAISGPENSGLEGICLAAENQLWIVNKKNPRHLLSLNADFSIQQRFDFNMVKDLSGLCYDRLKGQF